MAGDSSNKTLKIPALKFESVILENEIRRRPPLDGGDFDSFCCGVCFSDRGKPALMGTIDCCNHTFCFVCVVMWASVKSFCPICKLHFTAVYGPPKNVVFASKRVGIVPQRNQAYYHVLGNATTGVLNPYEEIRCTVCRGRADESHLRLLCDICDSAVHTYCVGFGTPVPGGAYFCYDCSLSRSKPDHKTEVHTALANQRTSRNVNVKLPPQRAIVPFLGHHNPSNFSSLSTHFSPPFLAGGRTFDEAYGPGERWHPLSAPPCSTRRDKGHTKERIRELENLVRSLQQQLEDERKKRELSERGIQDRIEQRIEEKLQQHFDQFPAMHKQQKLLKMHSTVLSSKPPD